MSEKITEEKDIKKIIIEYDDGSKEEIEKAFVGIYNEDDISGEVNVTFKFSKFSGKDLYLFVSSAIELGKKMGFFNTGVKNE